MLIQTNRQIRASHPVSLYTLLDSFLGGQPWLQWEPETLLLQFPEVGEDPIAEDKLLAVQAVAANSGLACAQAVAFEKAVHAFCNNPCVMDAYQPAYVEEIHYAVRQLLELIPTVHGKGALVQFVGEVPGYVAAAARYHSWQILPTTLDFAQALLNHLTGVSEKYPKHAELWRAYVELKPTLEQLDGVDYGALKAEGLKALDELQGGDLRSSILRKVLGCYLFDPTLLEAPKV